MESQFKSPAFNWFTPSPARLLRASLHHGCVFMDRTLGGTVALPTLGVKAAYLWSLYNGRCGVLTALGLRAVLPTAANSASRQLAKSTSSRSTVLM